MAPGSEYHYYQMNVMKILRTLRVSQESLRALKMAIQIKNLNEWFPIHRNAFNASMQHNLTAANNSKHVSMEFCINIFPFCGKFFKQNKRHQSLCEFLRFAPRVFNSISVFWLQGEGKQENISNGTSRNYEPSGTKHHTHTKMNRHRRTFHSKYFPRRIYISKKMCLNPMAKQTVPKIILGNAVKYWITYNGCVSDSMTAVMRHDVNTCRLNKGDQSKSISQLHWWWQCFGWITTRTVRTVARDDNNENGNDFFFGPAQESEWRRTRALNQPIFFSQICCHSPLNYLIYWLAVGTKKPHHTLLTTLLNDTLIAITCEKSFSPNFFHISIEKSLGIQITNIRKHSANVHGQYFDDTNMIYELL